MSDRSCVHRAPSPDSGRVASQSCQFRFYHSIRHATAQPNQNHGTIRSDRTGWRNVCFFIAIHIWVQMRGDRLVPVAYRGICYLEYLMSLKVTPFRDFGLRMFIRRPDRAPLRRVAAHRAPGAGARRANRWPRGAADARCISSMNRWGPLGSLMGRHAAVPAGSPGGARRRMRDDALWHVTRQAQGSGRGGLSDNRVHLVTTKRPTRLSLSSAPARQLPAIRRDDRGSAARHRP